MTLLMHSYVAFMQVPVEIRDANHDKVDALETEKENLQRALKGFKTLTAN